MKNTFLKKIDFQTPISPDLANQIKKEIYGWNQRSRKYIFLFFHCLFSIINETDSLISLLTNQRLIP